MYRKMTPENLEKLRQGIRLAMLKRPLNEPGEPTTAQPGSMAKIIVLRNRASNYELLFVEGDVNCFDRKKE